MRYLLDSSVMIALASKGHPHLDRCESWFASIHDFATCPVVEGALVRFLVRTGEPIASVRSILSHFTIRSGHEFWPDTASYLDTDLTKVRGHQQVTDAYLITLVRHHPGSKLATLDEGLARLYPHEVHLIPEPGNAN